MSRARTETGRAPAFSPESEKMVRRLLLQELGAAANAADMAELAQCSTSELADRARLKQEEKERAGQKNLPIPAVDTDQQKEKARVLFRMAQNRGIEKLSGFRDYYRPGLPDYDDLIKMTSHELRALECEDCLGLPKEDFQKLEPAKLADIFRRAVSKHVLSKARFFSVFGYGMSVPVFAVGLMLSRFPSFMMLTASLVLFGVTGAGCSFLYRKFKEQNRTLLTEAKTLLAALPPPPKQPNPTPP